MTQVAKKPTPATNGTGSANKNQPVAQVVAPTPVADSTTNKATEREKPKIETAIEKAVAKFGAVDKLEKLQDTRKNLQSFKVGDDGIKTQIQITDNQRNDFSTFNTDLIKTVIQSCLQVIDRKIAETEAEILQD